MDDSEFSPKPLPEGLDAAPLFVSLFLVLLVFFILLNVISQPDIQKAKAVMMSLSQAFNQKDPAKESPEFFTPDIGQPADFKQFYDSMRKAAGTVVKLEEGPPSRRGRMMVMSIPVASVFKPGVSVLLRPDLPLLEDIATTISQWKDGLTIETELVLHYSPPLEEASPATMLQTARLTTLLTYFTQKNISSRIVSTGLRAGNPDMVSLYYYVRPGQKKWPSPELPKSAP